MIDFKRITNPYDFANPISDDRFFVGRASETSDVVYYMSYAEQTNRPIHLAFVGARASGKTSLLNITELEARRRDFCPVRINLNEGDVETELAFFRKLFHSIAMASFAKGAFGGKGSAIYFQYLNLISTYTCSNIEAMPLIFALQVAMAQKSGNGNMPIADDILNDDLLLIHSEVKKPIVLLMDECNVLQKNRVII